MLDRALAAKDGKSRLIERHVKPSACLADDERYAFFVDIHFLPFQVEQITASEAGIQREKYQFPEVGRRGLEQTRLLVLRRSCGIGDYSPAGI